MSALFVVYTEMVDVMDGTNVSVEESPENSSVGAEDVVAVPVNIRGVSAEPSISFDADTVGCSGVDFSEAEAITDEEDIVEYCSVVCSDAFSETGIVVV